jgi:hypothetical protein
MYRALGSQAGLWVRAALMVRVDRPEIGDHPVDTRLVRVGFKCQWGTFVWIRPLVCRWKIHLGRDHIIIVNPRIVRDPSGVPTDRAPDGVVVPRIVEGAASSFRYGTEKKCTETDRKKRGQIRTFQEHTDNICPILLVWTRTRRGSLSTIYPQRGTFGQNLLHIVGKLKRR